MLKTVSTANGLVSPTFSGNVTLSDGNLVIGTAGKGIDFSATPGTGTSELLNDYEEGTYTATLTPGTSGSITLDAAGNTLSYTKVGRQVTVTGFIKVASVASPVGYIDVNLPFAIASGSRFSNSGSVFVNATVSAAMNAFVVVGIQSFSAFRIYIGTTTSASATAANEMQANSEIYATFTYFA
jgi:hypothetical protein